jgi:predicted nucleic acid-binding protein
VRAALYLDTSALLRAVLETGTSPEVQRRVAGADLLVTSRLTLVESARALLRARVAMRLPPARLADAQRDLDAVFAHCEVWELTPAICEAAGTLAPDLPLRALDALHLATFLAARRKIAGLAMLTTDERLAEAARAWKP